MPGRPGRSFSTCEPGRRARLDTTTRPAVDSLSPRPACARLSDGGQAAERSSAAGRRRSGERVRERGFQKSATIRWNEPLSPTLSPLVPRRERGHFSDGGCIKMRPRMAARRSTEPRIMEKADTFEPKTSAYPPSATFKRADPKKERHISPVRL